MFANNLIKSSAAIVSMIAATTVCYGAELRVAAPNAVKAALTEIGSSFTTKTGTHIKFHWGGSEAIEKRVVEGEQYDVVISTSASLDRLSKSGLLQSGSKTNFARSAIAVAVRAGAPRPDISNVESFKQALLSARTIAISSGASGRYLEKMFEHLGVAHEIKAKIKQPPSGAQIGDLLARGEAELGSQQVTELLHASGVDFVGRLPRELQSYTVWSGAVHSSAGNVEAGRMLLQSLASSAFSFVLQRTGLETIE
jgi:molybdate transport system substrate-binding protein